MSVNVVKLEEQWTPTTIHAAFSFHLTSSQPSEISVDLPLPSLGWKFSLSLTPQLLGKKPPKGKVVRKTDWIPTVCSFRHGSKIPWGNTSMQAQLLLVTEQRDPVDVSSAVCSDLAQLGTFQVALAHTSFVQCPLTVSRTLSLHEPAKIGLTVSISGCPFANGLFQAPCHAGEADTQAQLAKKSGDRLLGRSLTTGKLFDVKFFITSTRSTSGKTGFLHPTYASLSILDRHVNPPSAKFKGEWESTLAALNRRDNIAAQYVAEIPRQDDYEQFDSDFEDGDEASTVGAYTPSPFRCESDSGSVPQAVQSRSKSNGEGSISTLSSFELDAFSDQGSIIDQSQDDYTRDDVVVVKFAAHRTWCAFVWYCYTGNLEFNKLKSQLVEPGIACPQLPAFEDEPPFCSPKSMYRLADLLGDMELKAKALTAIKERMNKENILHETFSFFTSKYPDVRQVQLGILMKHIGSAEVKIEFVKMMKNIGEVSHAEPVLLSLCDRLAGSVPSSLSSFSTN